MYKIKIKKLVGSDCKLSVIYGNVGIVNMLISDQNYMFSVVKVLDNLGIIELDSDNFNVRGFNEYCKNNGIVLDIV